MSGTGPLPRIRIVDDGTNTGPVQLTTRIKHFTGEKPITYLEAYSVRFHPNSAEICERLESRGKAYIQSSGHKKYEGPDMAPWQALVPGRSQYKSSRISRRPETQGLFQGTEDIQSDVYIDLKEFYSEKNAGVLAMGRLQISPYNRRETTESLTGKLDREIPCGDFDIDEALWASIDGLEEIDKTEQARQSGWNNLVIPEKYRRLLMSLINNHMTGVGNKEQKVDPKSNLSMQIDLVRGKGRGLIILLHGPPDSGKPSTAETIAAYSDRPLYSITCGNIGTNIQDVEENLQFHTRLAEKWGRVLLLDEVDVFLMRRSWDDMHRNALVFVFLRHLEYYSGILFLTTNIVGVIDEAFKSRIHIALRYLSIDLDSTLKIWSDLLNRIAKDNETAEVKIEFDRTRLLDFARQHYQKHEADDTTWNARQIRNAFQTAIALGRHERLQRIKDEGLTPEQAMASGDRRMTVVRLTKRNFGIIAQTARDFEDYVTSIQGLDRQVVLMSQQRYDDCGKDMPKARKDYSSRRGGREKAAAKKEHGSSPSAARPRRGRETVKKTTYHEDDDDGEEEEKQERRSGFGRGDETLNDDDDDDSDEY
ncbi:P-loop containing nucleoside triphosphate hydrolase protein [Colletotrichum somersetense]|nr:P-loop containing nucleoside triphosphate hydrolase protein [Colletotrichum somersetense]